ncbi:unnamed protein product [Parnassius apollo]|uniref:(apollo) hypothetical protein n=1 Tax=Parnassius apollo TaxID=110799 RepID=A0A8S3XZE4_PARAO|nr:unnamed protein product [Parnassius apollo]
MVFCYKIITESPRKSSSLSPRKKSSSDKLNYISSTISELIGSLDYEGCSNDVIDSIPERDWRLLVALARKREENEERERLADQFRRMWLKEKQEREKIEAETSEQFKQYLQDKRARERSCFEFKQFQNALEQHLKKKELMDCIQYKERRCADLLALHDDRKMNELIAKAMDEESRAYLAADRRTRLTMADERRRRMQLVYAQRKEEDASKRRNAILRDASQRAAISNALSTWESALLRQELAAEDATRRARTMARLAVQNRRSFRLSRDREIRIRKARRLAEFTARLRDAVKTGQL